MRPADGVRPRDRARNGARAQASLRLRLTALYGGLFLVAGAVLLTITYALVAGQLNRQGIGPFEPGSLREPGLLAPERLAPERLARDGLSPQERVREGLDLLREATGQAAAQQREEALDELLTQSAVALGITAVLAIGLGWVVAGRALRPVREITATARRLSTHNLDERIGLRGGGGELKELADTFDAMLSRLAAAFEAQRRFAANASHELRTPLTVQRAAIDVALADPTEESLTAMAVRLRAATERHERLVAGLLALARSQAGVARREEVDLAAVAGAALAGAAGEIDGRELTAERRLELAYVSGDPVLLERLAANLVDNAVRHNVPGGRLTVETYGDGRAASLRVANSGRAVPEGDVPALFEPFRRMTADRTGPPSGFGLGLSIVAAVCTAHQGTWTARAREGGGLEVTVSLPSAPVPAGLTPAKPPHPPPAPPSASPAASP